VASRVEEGLSPPLLQRVEFAVFEKPSSTGRIVGQVRLWNKLKGTTRRSHSAHRLGFVECLCDR
jgi:hypothetical protein